MFSSNPFPHLPSSIDVFPFLPPSSFSIHHEKDDLHFPFISGEYMLHSTTNTAFPPPVIMENNHELGLGLQNCDHQDDVLDSSPEKKKIGSSKKHGHSKICTARGPRDRRVRFSIEVAQKFFSLQDLLGFDKASKTLDWLISNSMPAIKGLVEVSSATNQCKQKFLEVINGGSDETNNSKKKSSTSVARPCVDGKKKKSKRRCKDGFRVNNIARAEARARARERTKEKMRLKKQLDDDLKTLVPELNDGCEYPRLSPSDSALKSDCWSEIEPQIDYKNITWKCVMSPESSKQSKDSSFTSI